MEQMPMEEPMGPVVPQYEMMPRYEPVPVPFGSPRRARRRFAPEAPGSKRDRRRKELIERLDQTHWEGFEHRDFVFHDAHRALTQTYHMLLNRPGLLRDYAVALAEHGLDRNTSLRKIALYHAFLTERSEHTLSTESARVEDEARLARRSVRDKLLAVVEDRKRRLRDEREGGEFSAEFMLEPSQRQHSTRQLRNKGAPSRMSRTMSGTSGMGDEDDSGATLGASAAIGALLGWSETDTVATMVAAAADTAKRNAAEGVPDARDHVAALAKWSAILGDGSSALLGPPSGPTPLCGIVCGALAADGVALPPNNLFSSPSSLLAGVNSMSGNKGKKKGNGKSGGALSAADRAAVAAGDSDDSSAARAANVVSTGSGRLRWDTAKCLSQLGPARDIEVEADLIHIRKIGAKRRRR